MNNNKSVAFLALVFVALFSYWTFNQIKLYRDKEQGSAFENLPDTSSTFTQNLDNEEPIQATITGPTTISSQWVATDYKEGDISKGSYTVKSGDTLWEIAEAVYGDGTQWINILNANSQDIGFLPNGQQALIFPGQVLVLP